MKKIVIIIFCSLFLFGCKEKEVVNEIKAEPLKMQETVGTSLGLMSEKALTNSNYTHKLESSSVYSPDVKVINHYPEEMHYRLFFLLDYKQIGIDTKGQQGVKYVDLVVEPKSEEKFTFNISNIPDGLHDFIIICIREPNKYITKEEYIPPPKLYLHRRVTILVGNEIHPPKFPQEEINEVSNENIIQGVYLSEKKHGKSEKAISLFNKNNTPLWVNLSVSRPNTKVVIVGFLENEQVIFPESILNVTSNGMISHPININITKMENPKNLTLFVVENPFETTEDENGNLKKAPWDVKFSNKITFDYNEGDE
jgi:uncharacterized protein YcfL